MELISHVLISPWAMLPSIRMGFRSILKMKVCKRCKVEKELSDYDSKKHNCYICSSCKKEKYNKSRKTYGKSERKREMQYKIRYGISLADYDILLEKQHNKCAICKTHVSQLSTRLHVDHCHTTGVVRGLLCMNCNRGIGHLQDNIEILKEAILYLS